MEFNLILKNNNITDAVQLVKSNLNQCTTNDERVQRLDSMLATIEAIKTIETICRLEKEAIIKSLLEEPKTAAKNQPTTKYGDVDWAASILKKSKGTIYQYIHNPEINIPYIKSGQKLLFDKEKIYAWIENGEQKTPSQIRKGVNKKLFNLKKN